MSLVRLVKALSLQLQQTYAGSPLSFATATIKISSRSPRIVNNPLVCLASTSERQKRHSKVVAIAMSPTMFYKPVVYSPIIYPSYYLQAHLTCHNRFYGKYYEIPHACVISVYQALPLVFRAPGREVVSSSDPTLSRGETDW